MALVFSALMCHAPIVVPAVGGARAKNCEKTTAAMREVAARMVAAEPELLLLVSPHSARLRERFGLRPGSVEGDLGMFGAASVRADLPPSPELAAVLDLEAAPQELLDHGAMVPLAFLIEAGWKGPTAVVSLPWGPARDAEDLGRRATTVDGRLAVIASGDMSHRLIDGAPGGFHPRAVDFDAAFVAGVEAHDWTAAIAAEPRADAGEDVIDSTRVALGAARAAHNADLVAYEGPFGVGYCEAVFWERQPPLAAVARAAIRHQLGVGAKPEWTDGRGSSGVFVSLHKHGELRGCIGHLSATRERLVDEIDDVARAAAFEDRRFTGVSSDELDALEIEVSVLGPAEEVVDESSLDARRYGVIVASASESWRRGVLLPDLDGIDTPQQQIEICRRKGGITASEAVSLSRFEVAKHRRPGT